MYIAYGSSSHNIIKYIQCQKGCKNPTNKLFRYTTKHNFSLKIRFTGPQQTRLMTSTLSLLRRSTEKYQGTKYGTSTLCKVLKVGHGYYMTYSTRIIYLSTNLHSQTIFRLHVS